MKPALPIFAGALALLAVAACAGRAPPRPPGGAPANNPAANERQVELTLLLHFDTNKDGALSRVELEDGLKHDFALADRDGNGVLDPDETQAENQRRWQAAGPEASPLIDWNDDGVVDFTEFAATARTVFGLLDRNHDGQLTVDELRVGVGRGVGPPAGGRGRGGPGGRGGEGGEGRGP